MVTETPTIYAERVRPYMQRKREEGRLNWVFNIIDGRKEQEDIIVRQSKELGKDEEGFLILPDMNWDRREVEGMRLLCLVERRDVWSLRDLHKRDVEWLKRVKQGIVKAVIGLYGEKGVEEDMLRLYAHCRSSLTIFLLTLFNSRPAENSRLTVFQISRPITISTFMSLTSGSKPTELRLSAKLLGSRTLSRSLRTCLIRRMRPWQMSI